MSDRSDLDGRARRTMSSFRDGGSGRIRVLLADDHQVLRQALRLMLEMDAQIEVVGDVSDGRQAVEAVDRLDPDVVLMDLAMPILNGVEATAQIIRSHARTKVLVLTGFAEDDRVLAAMRAGASGYLLKRSDAKELLLAIQVVHLGNQYFSSAISRGRSPVEYLLQAQREGPTDALTSREREVLQLVAEGHTNQEIADRLVLSIKTVEAHKSHIMAKIKATSRADMIKYAIRKGITSLGDDDASESGTSIE